MAINALRIPRLDCADQGLAQPGSVSPQSCAAAISTGLLESEHFGRETAAFIGARAREIEWRKREEDSATCRSICNLSILNQPVVISRFTSPRVVFRVNPAPLSVSGLSACLSVWHTACICHPRKAGNMAQRSIEILIGKLLTDESFRQAFLRNHSTVLQAFSETGHELTSFEIAALMATPKRLWNEFASQVDPRLQKANLGKGRA